MARTVHRSPWASAAAVAAAAAAASAGVRQVWARLLGKTASTFKPSSAPDSRRRSVSRSACAGASSRSGSAVEKLGDAAHVRQNKAHKWRERPAPHPLASGLCERESANHSYVACRRSASVRPAQVAAQLTLMQCKQRMRLPRLLNVPRPPWPQNCIASSAARTSNGSGSACAASTCGAASSSAAASGNTSGKGGAARGARRMPPPAAAPAARMGGKRGAGLWVEG